MISITKTMVKVTVQVDGKSFEEISELLTSVQQEIQELRSLIEMSTADLRAAFGELKSAWETERGEIREQLDRLEELIGNEGVAAEVAAEMRALTEEIKSTVQAPVPVEPPVDEEPVDGEDTVPLG